MPSTCGTNVAPTYYSTLDWLRGFAALQVLAYHVLGLSNWQEGATFNPLYWLVRKGWMGVDLFFVLCGCVITYSLAHLHTQFGVNTRRVFLIKRGARLLPLYYLTIVFWLLFVEYPSHVKPFDQFELFFRYSTLTHSFPFENYGIINAPNWSIGVEIQFYALMLFVTPVALKMSYWRIAAFSITLAWASKLLIYAYIEIEGKTILQGMPFFCQLPPMFDAFGIGIILGKFLYQDATQWLPYLQKKRYSIWLVTALLLSITLTVWWSKPNAMAFPLFHITMRTALEICFGLLVLSLVILQKETPLVTKGLMQPLGYIGVVSYGIYLWHWPVLHLLQKHALLSPAQLLIMTVLFTLIVSSLSWHIFENPCMQYFGQRVKHKFIGTRLVFTKKMICCR